jgi:surface antigen
LQNNIRKSSTIFPRLSGTARTAVALGLFSLFSACAQTTTLAKIDPARQSMALLEVKQKQARGQRVWCVPYARDLSGVEIRGNAKTWWGKAHNTYERGPEPDVGAVMSFRATRGMPLGHVAVVSDVITDREIIVNHANWHRNKVSLKMGVKDVSKNNDWSMVRVETRPGQYGKFYPVNGFIYPNGNE